MIVCLGTTPTVQRTMTFESLAVDDVNRATQVAEYASGKSINVARVLHTMGVALICTGFVGGERGRFLCGDLDRAGITHNFVQVDAPTRLCTTVIDRSAGTATELIEEPSPLTAHDYHALLAKLGELLPTAKLLVLSGSLPPGANDNFYAECMKSALLARVRVIIDAVGEPLRRALVYRPFIVKPNESEIARTLDADVSDEQALRGAMRQIVTMGAQWVVTTRGRRGTIVTDGRRFWEIDAPNVAVVSAIGSGDSFTAGLAASVVADKPVPEACLLATACGSANAMTAYAGHVTKDDIAALLPRISLSRLQS